jgi:hypothetical protein
MQIDIVTREEFASLMDEMVQLKQRVAELERLQDEWVDTKIAIRIVGVSRTTLEKERQRPGTKLEYKYEGAKPLYSRASLFNYNEARRIPRGIMLTKQ